MKWLAERCLCLPRNIFNAFLVILDAGALDIITDSMQVKRLDLIELHKDDIERLSSEHDLEEMLRL